MKHPDRIELQQIGGAESRDFPEGFQVAGAHEPVDAQLGQAQVEIGSSFIVFQHRQRPKRGSRRNGGRNGGSQVEGAQGRLFGIRTLDPQRQVGHAHGHGQAQFLGFALGQHRLARELDAVALAPVGQAHPPAFQSLDQQMFARNIFAVPVGNRNPAFLFPRAIGRRTLVRPCFAANNDRFPRFEREQLVLTSGNGQPQGSIHQQVHHDYDLTDKTSLYII